MGSLRLPYREEGDPPELRPTLDVRLYLAPNGEWSTRALVDTGSPITISDRGAGEAILVNFGRAGAETRTIGLLGARPMVQFEDIELSLVADPAAAWAARVGFVKDPAFRMPFQGLLGTQGFLDRWAVTFNRYHNYFQLDLPDDVV